MAKEWDLQLSRLRLADGASFDSALTQHEAICMDQTRVELLQELREWYCKPQRPILWLSGMAGTGKSTIARTIASELYANDRLAASFFFRRAGNLSEATRFVSTLAYKLAITQRPNASPSLRELIGKAMINHEDVQDQGLRRQWNVLIVEPLSRIQSTQRLALTFVIDALDECGSEDDIRLILQLFIELKNINNVDLSVLITSRPETTLVRGFRNLPEILHRRLDLREIPRDIVEHDLYVYMRTKLGQIKPHNECDWPTEEDLRSLVQKADCLFIYAATVCLFIESSHYDCPEDCLSNILQDRSTGGEDTAAIDGMYTQILDSALAKPGQSKEMTELSTDRFKIIVGSIIALLEMLPVTALGGLISLKVEIVQHALSTLESVLDIPSDTRQPLRLLHPSFRDFLFDQARCGDKPFHLQEETTHNHLAICCLDILCTCLRRNICDLLPDSSPREVSGDVLSLYLPKHVQYACQHWVGHLENASAQQRIHVGFCDGGKIHVFFQEKFLYWVEAMSLIGKMPKAVLMMNKLVAMLKVSCSALPNYNGDDLLSVPTA